MTIVAVLVQALRARGVTLRADGDRLKVRPASAVTPDEVEALKRHKAEVLALLAPAQDIALDPKTLAQVLGPDANDDHAVACLRCDVLAAVREVKAGIRSGVLPSRRLVHGHPLADWLNLDDVARLLREGA
jgi:hypothetical protein